MLLRTRSVFTIIEFYFYIRDLFEGTYTLRILESFFELLIKITPYFFISILIQVLLLKQIQKREFKFEFKNNVLSISIAALFGMLSPLPTYAAIPVGLSFVSLGAPLGAIIAFIIASPLINPSVFFLTITQLGVTICLSRVVAAFLLALFGGLLSGPVLKTVTLTKMDDYHPKKQRPFLKELYRSFLFFGKYFLIALLISAIVKALVSPQLITEILGKHIQQSLLVAIALGVPFYSCGGAAIPFVEVLRDMGINEGAVLAFFLAGPATKIETLFVFKSILGLKIFLYYLLITFIGAYLCGLILWVLL